MWQSNRAQDRSGFSEDLFSFSNQPQEEISTSISHPPLVLPAPLKEIMATAVGVTTLIGVLVLIRRVIEHWKCSESRLLQEVQAQRPTFPCQRCRYFNPSAFLYCAVNPTKAMTPEAQSCTDFCDR